MDKSPDAFRTISEVADWLDTPAHVLRFWESRFPQVRPVKRAGGRRYYRPSDVALLSGIKKLLHDDGLTIRGVQKMLREQGIRHVASLGSAPGDAAQENEEENIFAGGEEVAAAAGAETAEATPSPPPEPIPLRPTAAPAAQAAPDSAPEPAGEPDLFSRPAPAPAAAAPGPVPSTSRDGLIDRLRGLDPATAEAEAPRLAEIYARLSALRARMAAAPKKNGD
ncbi:MerR family transcriptional regulator [Solirhodobacter olei]|uniref:MerR family transcriptional regulator n=1 Tax=Solirhodobacter olei TaxID=2493082 RepID=UPI000FD6BC19|nr:MerR family transcriptional regulator [Solirhodobacter olei]